MEPFIDFGLFEILFVVGITFAALKLYSRTATRVLTVGLGVLGTITLAVISASVTAKALAIVCALISLVNAYVIITLSRQIDVANLLRKSHRDMSGKSRDMLQRLAPQTNRQKGHVSRDIGVIADVEDLR